MRPDPFADMDLIDLSLPIVDDGPIWSAEPKCIVHNWFVQGRNHGKPETLNMNYYCLVGHQATHFDAPFHMRGDGATVSDIPPQRFLGWSKVLDFRDKKLGDHITAADLVARGAQPKDRLLLCTGWDRYYNPLDETYFNLDHPHFSEDAIYWALENRIEVLGMDVPSLDPYLVDHPKVFERLDHFPIVIELMTNLTKIVGKEVYLMALPIHLHKGDGAWVRAVAWVPRG